MTFLRNLVRSSVGVIIVTGLAVAACLPIPYWLLRADYRAIPMWKAILLLLIFLATFFVPFVVAAASILHCLSPAIPKRTRLVRIVTAYFASILSAAGVYYALAIVG